MHPYAYIHVWLTYISNMLYITFAGTPGMVHVQKCVLDLLCRDDLFAVSGMSGGGSTAEEGGGGEVYMGGNGSYVSVVEEADARLAQTLPGWKIVETRMRDLCMPTRRHTYTAHSHAAGMCVDCVLFL